MNIRHAHRCVPFMAPPNPADLANALTDAVVSTPPGKMLVYRIAQPDFLDSKLMAEAAKVVGRMPECGLVSWPNDGPDNAERTWCWAIQKPGRCA